MDNTKQEELEKACKKEKDHKVRTRMITVRMVRARNIAVDETADILIRCPSWVRNWLRRYDEGVFEGLRDLQMRTARKNTAQRHGRHGCRRDRPSYHSSGAAAVHTGTDGHESAHHVHPKDHAPVQPVPKGSTKDSCQPGKQKGNLELEVPPQTTNFVPGKGGICRDHAG